jgi:hypothetical protein
MKVFLASVVEGLRDARLSLLERLEKACLDRIRLVSYEKDKHRYPTLTPEETCLALVRECEAVITLLDQYYGSPCKAVPGISITHAEIRAALDRKLIVIPVLRTQTLCEYNVWRINKGIGIKFAHVKEARIFEIVDELYKVCNCHSYDNLTSERALSDIAIALDHIISGKAIGSVQHLTLASGLSAPPDSRAPAGESGALAQVPQFNNFLEIAHLNALYRAVTEIANSYGLSIPSVTWKVDDWLTADHLNKLLANIEAIYQRAGLSRPQWSFGQFGRVVSAPQLNEVRDSLRGLAHH